MYLKDWIGKWKKIFVVGSNGTKGRKCKLWRINVGLVNERKFFFSMKYLVLWGDGILFKK